MYTADDVHSGSTLGLSTYNSMDPNTIPWFESMLVGATDGEKKRLLVKLETVPRWPKKHRVQMKYDNKKDPFFDPEEFHDDSDDDEKPKAKDDDKKKHDDDDKKKPAVDHNGEEC